jgi:hypothetical protein
VSPKQTLAICASIIVAGLLIAAALYAGPREPRFSKAVSEGFLYRFDKVTGDVSACMLNPSTRQITCFREPHHITDEEFLNARPDN